MLYFAPINLLSNYVYRHLLLKEGADYVFSELIMINNLEKAEEDDKLKYFKEDEEKTIIQIGVSNVQEVQEGVAFVQKNFPNTPEININMGCPQSTMQEVQVCGGLLHNIPLLQEIAGALVKEVGERASVKLRLGTSPENVLIHEYIQALDQAGIRKIYIHARTLRHPYHKPARYELFTGLRERYPHLTLVFNGDVDGFQAYQAIGEGDVLIARAGLSNPFVFADIKARKNYREGSYDPILKDPELLRGDYVQLGARKIAFIRNYLALAQQENLRQKLICANMSWLVKGASKASELIKELNKGEEQPIKVFENWLEETTSL